MRGLRSLGYASIALWLATFFIALTMMWDKTWMESNPPSEVIVAVCHGAAVAVGLGLGASLLAPRVRQEMSLAQRSSYVAACVLAMVSLSRFL